MLISLFPAITKILGFSQSEKERKFINALLSNVSEDSLCVIDPKVIFQGCSNAFKNLQKTKAEDPVIDISVLDERKEYAIITVICQDKPFIIDSIANEIHLNDMGVKLFANSLINPNEFIDSNTSEKLIVLQFYVSNWFENTFYLQLKDKIYNVLHCVHLAVSDWHKIKEVMKTSMLRMKKSISSEYTSFLEFLLSDHFIFLGYIPAETKNQKISNFDINNSLGLIKSAFYQKKLPKMSGKILPNNIISIKKSDLISNVHRRSNMLCLLLKENEEVIHVFYGFLISKVYYMSVLTIPLIKEKIHYVIEAYGYPKHSYNAKELVSALEDFPRSELLEISKEELLDLAAKIVSLNNNPKTKLYIREDKEKRYVSCIVFIPKSKFYTQLKDSIQSILSSQFHGSILRSYMKIGERELVRMQFIIEIIDRKIPDYSIQRMEKLISGCVNVWQDDFEDVLSVKYSKKEADIIFNKYKNAFSVKYINTFHPEQSLHDIKAIEEAIQSNKVIFRIYNSAKSDKELVQIKIFSLSEELPLSILYPIIDNLGFFTIDVATFEVNSIHFGRKFKLFIHYFRTKPKNITNNYNLKFLEEGLDKIWCQNVDNDFYNSLILYADLNYREVNLMRAYFKYLKQIKFEFSGGHILSTLLKYSRLTYNLTQLFDAKFNPEILEREVLINKIENEIREEFKNISIFSEDKILNSFLALILATKRTNFYVKNDAGQFKDFISLKIYPKELENVPLPKPEIDTFVYSAKFKAIHLRSSKTARGGLRWTDRKEDFRTEILGLMKAQVTKNSLIVPSGCKGGFVVKETSTDIQKTAVEVYKDFLRGILDITDNIVNHKVVYPKDVVRYDEDDYYFVVAADKGTATFSDYANSVSKEYNFWLGDAFASGGSAGYDHKKMAITAKGAWVCVKNHFESLDIDIDKQPFTCIGIGDMSGDVFGNGMLLSKNIKLLAAFNHIHIFVDPNPDCKKSYEERQRLFSTKGSKWSDYNRNLISQGGGVFDRSSKSIPMSQEIKDLLNIHSDTISPIALIKAILKID